MVGGAGSCQGEYSEDTYVVTLRSFEDTSADSISSNLQHNDAVLDCCVTPLQHGNALITGGRDGIVRIWK